MTEQITSAVDATTPEFDKGSWQSTLKRSADLQIKSSNDRKKASILLWDGAKAGINSWNEETASEDVSGENLYNEVLKALGKSRKGDASKIKTVAVAVRNHGLSLVAYPNLAKAYTEAVRLTKTVQTEADEDSAAEKAVEALAKEAPDSTGTPEGAAKIVLSTGLDEAARLLLDALGATNEAAHRALLRAIAQEIAGRVKPVVKAASTKPKTGATKAATGGATASPKATVKSGAAKTKAAPVTAGAATPAKAEAPAPKVKTKAAPVKSTKAEAAPVDEATKAKAKPVVVKRG